MAPALGLLATTLFLREAFQTTANVEPSEKARHLAEGISGSMNATAIGIAVSCVAWIPAVYFAVRLYRASKQKPPPG